MTESKEEEIIFLIQVYETMVAMVSIMDSRYNMFF